jgi:glyoxylase-like metal-dependent hydrolase (beta-lactamase superfamily II)
MGRVSIAIVSAVLSVWAAQAPTVVRTGDPAKRGYAEADFPRVQRLAENVYSYEALRSAGAEKFTTVSLFVVTPAGVLVADGQGSVPETQKLVDAIAKVTPQPITTVVVGSDHGDHTGGNRAFPANVQYYIHPTSQAILSIPGATLVSDRTAILLGGTAVEIRFLGRAHTGGDLAVYLPKDKVLFMSEIYLNRIFPAMRSAFPSEWVRAIEKAQAMDVNVYVPGHGFVESPAILREELETFRKAIVSVIDEAKRLRASGLDADAAASQAKFGDLETWSLRESQGATAIKRVYLELDGKLK